MNNNTNERNKKRSVYLSLFVFFSICLISIELLKFLDVSLSTNKQINELIYGIASRAIGSAICILMISYCSFGYLFSFDGKNKLKNFILLIPCWLVVINNFPIIAVAKGSAFINENVRWYLIALFALQCLFVGLFEEVAFRGCVFMLILQGRHNTRKDVFISIVLSSAIFGAIHIANLFAGASLLPVIQQVGYSFLIGSMCALTLLITKKIWTSVWMHAIFNFAGGLIPTLGTGKIWNAPTIIITIILSVAVTIYSVVLFFRFDISTVESLFYKKEKKEM